jgi:phosphoribosyl-ATP pyrophosphohydrolase/phosphoribosyl-AMP cyclohydrolase
MKSSRSIDWVKGQGMLPAIVQHAASGAVLMLGYMTAESLAATESTGRVTFWSRSKNRLWTKGETSGNFLEFRDFAVDCDGDALLVFATPAGPVCHLGTPTCWGKDAPQPRALATSFLGDLEAIIEQRVQLRPPGSYTTKLLAQGMRRVAQKVGEEGLELALAAVVQSDVEITGEAADLLYHMLVLLQAKGLSLAHVSAELQSRHFNRGRSDAD